MTRIGRRTPYFPVGTALEAALRDAANRPDLIVALAAAGRIRFPADVELPLWEARALVALGFSVQAGYRLKERVALGGEDIPLAALSVH